MQPTTRTSVVLTVVWFMGLLSMGGLYGTIHLCKLSNDPELINAAVKMIQTDPSSALAAMNLLHTDANMIATIAGLTGVCIGGLSGMLNSTKSQNPDVVVRESTSSTASNEPPAPPLPPLPPPQQP